MKTELEIQIELANGEVITIFYPVDTLSNPLNWDIYAKVVGIKTLEV